MITLPAFRARYPEFNGIPDYDLASILHRQYYSDMTYEQFARLAQAPLDDGRKADGEEPYFFSKAGHSAMTIAEGIGRLPMGVVDTVRDVYAGSDVDVSDIEAIRAPSQRERKGRMGQEI
jgi:hypothetical protein